eukprot:scaffold7841_cov128-Isochrysis_galbana.AAC.14
MASTADHGSRKRSGAGWAARVSTAACRASRPLLKRARAQPKLHRMQPAARSRVALQVNRRVCASVSGSQRVVRSVTEMPTCWA